jgi:hypothetical protein
MSEQLLKKINFTAVFLKLGDIPPACPAPVASRDRIHPTPYSGYSPQWRGLTAVRVCACVRACVRGRKGVCVCACVQVDAETRDALLAPTTAPGWVRVQVPQPLHCLAHSVWPIRPFAYASRRERMRRRCGPAQCRCACVGACGRVCGCELY